MGPYRCRHVAAGYSLMMSSGMVRTPRDRTLGVIVEGSWNQQSLSEVRREPSVQRSVPQAFLPAIASSRTARPDRRTESARFISGENCLDCDNQFGIIDLPLHLS